MAITSDGNLWGWGFNVAGQVGDGTTIDRLTPAFIMGDVMYVSAGGNHTMAIRTDGSLWGWGGDYWVDAEGNIGEGNLGQIGDGYTIPRHNPVWIMDDVIQVSAGALHTMAIRADNSLWGWGSHNAGQIGDNTSTGPGLNPARPAPRQIMDDVIAVSAGHFHTIAMTSDRSLWAWGWNDNGQLGDGTTISRNSPVRMILPPRS